jgi:hypothetical protein
VSSWGIIFATGSQNKPMKTWRNPATDSKRIGWWACMRIIHTHAAWLGSTDDKHAKNMRSKSPESSNYRTKPSSSIIVRSIWENIILYVIELTE